MSSDSVSPIHSSIAPTVGSPTTTQIEAPTGLPPAYYEIYRPTKIHIDIIAFISFYLKVNKNPQIIVEHYKEYYEQYNKPYNNPHYAHLRITNILDQYDPSKDGTSEEFEYKTVLKYIGVDSKVTSNLSPITSNLSPITYPKIKFLDVFKYIHEDNIESLTKIVHNSYIKKDELYFIHETDLTKSINGLDLTKPIHGSEFKPEYIQYMSLNVDLFYKMMQDDTLNVFFTPFIESITNGIFFRKEFDYVMVRKVDTTSGHRMPTKYIEFKNTGRYNYLFLDTFVSLEDSKIKFKNKTVDYSDSTTRDNEYYVGAKINEIKTPEDIIKANDIQKDDFIVLYNFPESPTPNIAYQVQKINEGSSIIEISADENPAIEFNTTAIVKEPDIKEPDTKDENGKVIPGKVTSYGKVRGIGKIILSKLPSFITYAEKNNFINGRRILKPTKPPPEPEPAPAPKKTLLSTIFGKNDKDKKGGLNKTHRKKSRRNTNKSVKRKPRNYSRKRNKGKK